MAKVVIIVKEGDCLIVMIEAASYPGEHSIPAAVKFGIALTLTIRRWVRLCPPSPHHTPLTQRHFMRLNSFPSETLAILMFNFYKLKEEVICFPILFFIAIVLTLPTSLQAWQKNRGKTCTMEMEKWTRHMKGFPEVEERSYCVGR